jgi:enamine deaminase RidA (YjgF/YER057c/UK114 family)
MSLSEPTAPIRYLHDPEAPKGTPPVAVRAGDLIFVGGQMPAHPTLGVPLETRLLPGMPHHGSQIDKQLRYLYERLEKSLPELGTSLHHILKINSFHTRSQDIDMAIRVRRDWFSHEAPPPSTLVMVPELPIRDVRALLDFINVGKDAERPLEQVAVSKSPAIAQVKAIGWAVYSQVLKGGGLVFTRGTAPHNADGVLPQALPNYPFPYNEEQVQFQLRYEMERLRDLLNDAGCTFADVVKAEIYVTDMSMLASIDEIWEEYFPVDPPARVIIPLQLAIPPMVVETELIAIDPSGPYRKEVIRTSSVPKPLSPESQAVKAGPYLFLSGQMATDYQNGLALEARVDGNFPFHKHAARLEAEYILKNVDEICRAAGTSIHNLLKRRVYHVDLADTPKAEAPWRAALGDRLPPTSVLKINGSLPVPACRVQYDLIAYAP